MKPRRISPLLIIALASATALGTSAAMAQKDAGSKMRGEHTKSFWSSRFSGQKLRSSRECANDLYQYTRTVPKMEPSVVQGTSEELGRTLESTKQDLKVIRQEHGKDKDVAGRLDAIEKHLDAAIAQHKKAHEQCCKADGDTATAMECCSEAVKEIEKAQAEHGALTRKLFSAEKETPAEHKH